jgi:parvulin-like peptidyl-prolyl isomerase
LRILLTTDRGKIEGAKQRIGSGEIFSKVAHDLSEDPSAPGGGYIGDTEVAQMDTKLADAAAQLNYGQTSDVVDLGNRFVLLHRLPREFKEQANALFDEASASKERGDVKGSVEKA